MSQKICTREGCGRLLGRHGARGLCSKHYLYARRTGSLEKHSGPHVFDSIEDRFWSKVDAAGDCWEWKSTTSEAGYGKFGAKVNGKNGSVYAHRWAYENLVGAIPEGLQVDHLCRNRKCVNPDHLEPVTPRTNYLRGYAPSALSATTGYCGNGHEWTAENTYWRLDGGGRMCRSCARDSQLRLQQRKRAAA